VAKATSAAYAFNEAKVLNASHVVVFCSRASIDDSHLQGC
jgi:nitroreductase/dihydropteridine reductase